MERERNKNKVLQHVIHFVSCILFPFTEEGAMYIRNRYKNGYYLTANESKQQKNVVGLNEQ